MVKIEKEANSEILGKRVRQEEPKKDNGKRYNVSYAGLNTMEIKTTEHRCSYTIDVAHIAVIQHEISDTADWCKFPYEVLNTSIFEQHVYCHCPQEWTLEGHRHRDSCTPFGLSTRAIGAIFSNVDLDSCSDQSCKDLFNRVQKAISQSKVLANYLALTYLLPRIIAEKGCESAEYLNLVDLFKNDGYKKKHFAKKTHANKLLFSTRPLENGSIRFTFNFSYYTQSVDL